MFIYVVLDRCVMYEDGWIWRGPVLQQVYTENELYTCTALKSKGVHKKHNLWSGVHHWIQHSFDFNFMHDLLHMVAAECSDLYILVSCSASCSVSEHQKNAHLAHSHWVLEPLAAANRFPMLGYATTSNIITQTY